MGILASPLYLKPYYDQHPQEKTAIDDAEIFHLELTT